MSHEVGIIGAGAHGASAAFHLARRGVRAIVFERGAHAAAGPTGQASGVVRSYYTNETLARIARESTAFLADFPEHVGAHAENGYVRTGGLYLHDEADEADVRSASAGLTRAGVGHTLLDRDALREDFPGLSLDGVAVGVWEPGAGYADPAATTRGLAARAAELGATILTGTTVAAVREHPGGVSVRLADGMTHAVDRLLVAAGPWTGPLLEQVGVALPLTAERHVVAGLRHGADTADSAIGHVLIDVGRGYYSRPAAGDEFLLGPLAPTAPTDPGDFDPRISPDEFRSLATLAAARAPIRASASRSRGWAALYDVSPDWQPVIGQVGERIFVDAGTSGHGFKLAPVLGDLVARLLLGDADPALAPFHPDRFAAPAGLASGFGTARILGCPGGGPPPPTPPPLHPPLHDPPAPRAIARRDLGWQPAAWRHDPDATRILDPDYWVAQVRLAQEGLLDFVTLEDRLALQSEGFGPQAPRTDRVRGRLDAVLLASRIAPLTEHIGIIPTAVTTHTEPFHLSKAIATLDFVSTGRAGIRLTVGAGGATEAKLVGRRELPDITLDSIDTPETVALIETLFDEAADYAEVLRRLWDSWEDDAEIRDQATGRFIDRGKLHYIDFVGEHFSVKGPSIVPRPPQGQPIVSILGHAATPYRLGARSSDVIYVTPHDDDDAAHVLQEVRTEEAGVGRDGTPQLVFADLVVFLDDDAEAARSRRARYDELAGETYHSDALIFAGTPAELADVVERWSAAGYAGLRLRPASNEIDVPAISRGLVPELQRRGLFRTAYEASTLRGLLGLERPNSRYAAGGADAAGAQSTPNADDLVEATR